MITLPEIPPDSKPVRRILTIDGGGIMGVFPASFLATLEEDLGQPIGGYFDLICGTSTGGILALGLALGMPAKDILALYEHRGPHIFGQAGPWWRSYPMDAWRFIKHIFAPKHDADLLYDELYKVFGKKRIGEAKQRLLIPAWDADRQSVYIYKTAHHPRLKGDYKRPVLDAAMGTAAAPTYYRRHITSDNVGLLDGGVWANNPVALGVVEALTLLGWPADSLHILSLGCMNEVYMLSETPGLGKMARDVARLFMSGQSSSALGVAKLLTGDEHQRPALHRICPDAPKNFFKLDDTRKIGRLKGLGHSYARERRPHIEKIFFSDLAEPFTPIYQLEKESS